MVQVWIYLVLKEPSLLHCVSHILRPNSKVTWGRYRAASRAAKNLANNVHNFLKFKCDFYLGGENKDNM